MRRRRFWALSFASIAGVALAVACGSSDSGDGSDAGTADGAGGDGAGGGDGSILADGASGDDAAGGDGGLDGAHADGAKDGGGDGAVVAHAYLYAARNESTHVLYGYAWDAVSGHLTPIDMDGNTAGVQGAPMPLYPMAVVAHPNGKWVYVVTQGSPVEVAAYSVDATTGVLTKINADARADAGVNDLTIAPGYYITGLAAMDPAGRCLYVGDQNGSLLALTIDANGALTFARAVAGVGATWMAVDPASRFVVTSNNGAVAIHKLDAVSGLPIGPDGGAGPGVTYTTPAGSSIALNPTGTYAFTPFYYTSKIHAFRIDPTTPALTVLPETAVTNEPVASVVDPTGSYLYTAGTNATPPGILAIGDGGALTEIPTDAGFYSVLGYPLTFDPNATRLYTSFYPYASIVFATVGPNGTLVAGGSADDGGAAYNTARTFAWVVPH